MNIIAKKKPSWHGVIAEELVPMPSYNGLLATKAIASAGVAGVGEQFLEGAGTYDERYLHIDAKQIELANAFSKAGIDISDANRILDIGCGSGNATYALFRMAAKAHVFATDLSPSMANLLRSRLIGTPESNRVTTFVADASRVCLEKGVFDAVVGSSMLHHLVDPRRFLLNVLPAVATGGVAVFTEPFRAGHLLFRHLLDSIVTRASTDNSVGPEHLQMFKDYMFTIDVSSTMHVDYEHIEMLDDKWMFTKKFFHDIADETGMNCTIVSYPYAPNQFEARVHQLIYLLSGQEFEMANSIKDICATFDKFIDEDLSHEFPFEAAIVFNRKAEAHRPRGVSTRSDSTGIPLGARV
jgi:SAM-dependent methyltransferase